MRELSHCAIARMSGSFQFSLKIVKSVISSIQILKKTLIVDKILLSKRSQQVAGYTSLKVHNSDHSCLRFEC